MSHDLSNDTLYSAACELYITATALTERSTRKMSKSDAASYREQAAKCRKVAKLLHAIIEGEVTIVAKGGAK
jgi:hypothetical protein